MEVTYFRQWRNKRHRSKFTWLFFNEEIARKYTFNNTNSNALHDWIYKATISISFFSHKITKLNCGRASQYNRSKSSMGNLWCLGPISCPIYRRIPNIQGLRISWVVYQNSAVRVPWNLAGLSKKKVTSQNSMKFILIRLVPNSFFALLRNLLSNAFCLKCWCNWAKVGLKTQSTLHGSVQGRDLNGVNRGESLGIESNNFNCKFGWIIVKDCDCLWLSLVRPVLRVHYQGLGQGCA